MNYPNLIFNFMKSAFSIICLSLLVTIFGCDKIDAPYGESKKTDTTTSDTEVVMRKILIEDYTGHYCGNCPRAARTLTQIHDLYGDKIVSLAAHVSDQFAAPAGVHYPEDYRTETGNELDSYFGNSATGLPNGLINRKEFNGQTIIQYTDWSSRATELLTLQPEAFMWITPSYNTSSRILNVSIKTKILQDIGEGLSIALYLTEDSIISAQKDYDQLPDNLVENYVHRHMLRGSISGTWGNTLSAASSYITGEEYTTTGTFTLPAEWNDEHVEIIAVLYRTANKEVVQAEDQDIK
ncbi:MAG TPA: Omp28 family outer membrane lipoprotein [Flavobacteriales bacterium]|nr:Omp28 family outer membrane lipoprotein [Flavobacteriales bacterium]